MSEPLTIDFEPDNRDVYRTLDGRGLFRFRFEQGSEGWTIHADHLPDEVAVRLIPTDNGPREVRLDLHRPVNDLRQTKDFASQWAEQAWAQGRSAAVTDDYPDCHYREENPA